MAEPNGTKLCTYVQGGPRSALRAPPEAARRPWCPIMALSRTPVPTRAGEGTPGPRTERKAPLDALYASWMHFRTFGATYGPTPVLLASCGQHASRERSSAPPVARSRDARDLRDRDRPLRNGDDSRELEHRPADLGRANWQAQRCEAQRDLVRVDMLKDRSGLAVAREHEKESRSFGAPDPSVLVDHCDGLAPKKPEHQREHDRMTGVHAHPSAESVIVSTVHFAVNSARQARSCAKPRSRSNVAEASGRKGRARRPSETPTSSALA